MLAVVGRTAASVTNRTAPVAFSQPVASQRCPSRPTWARVAPTYSRTKCEAPEPEAGAEQGPAQKLRHGASGTLHESGERFPALLNRFVARGSRLYQHKPCSQERPPPGCSRWLGRPLPSRDKVSAARAVPMTQPRAVLEVRAPLPDPQARVLRRLPMPLAASDPKSVVGRLPVGSRRSDNFPISPGHHPHASIPLSAKSKFSSPPPPRATPVLLLQAQN